MWVKQRIIRLMMGCFIVPVFGRAETTVQKPNILVILTDQQSAKMMSCAGNSWVNTPNLDRLAKEGIRFERAYAANPVCVPSRFSLMTGMMPSVIQMEDNDGQKNSIPRKILDSALGNLFANAGYETVYAGKMHLTGSNTENGYENPLAYGFQKYITPDDKEGRERTVETCVNFLKSSRENPFLLIASLINPHDICYLPLLDWTIAEKQKNPFSSSKAVQLINEILKIPEGMSRDEFIEKYCPPLPDNFEIPENELPSFITIKENNYIGWSRKNYTEKDWRLYRYLYARLTEIVDRQIGEILDALEEAGLEKNTLIVFTSDHGDQDASHRTGLKGYLYEESANIPFIMKWNGIIRGNRTDSKHLVSNGLDLIPTLCDFSGIPVPELLAGKSLKPLVIGNGKTKWRQSLVVENNSARLIIFDTSWKYMVDANPDIEKNTTNSNPEMLFYLGNDHGELINLAHDPSYEKQLRKGLKMLRSWYSINNLVLEEMNLKSNNHLYFN